jgi:hypothetical protein
MTRFITIFRTLIQRLRKRRQLAEARRRRMKELRKRDPFIY